MSNSERFTMPIVRLALDNSAYRHVVVTGEKAQVVLMCLEPGQEIGSEVHDDHDQVLVFVEGSGQAILDGHVRSVEANDLTFVPAGVEHNFINTGDRPLRLYTMYAPPEHADDVHQDDKPEGEHDH